jgi:hypothetical protein
LQIGLIESVQESATSLIHPSTSLSLIKSSTQVNDPEGPKNAKLDYH